MKSATDNLIDALVEYGHYHARYMAVPSWSTAAGPMVRKDRRLRKVAASALAVALRTDEDAARDIWGRVEKATGTHLIFTKDELERTGEL